jgi:hypothetical protein
MKLRLRELERDWRMQPSSFARPDSRGRLSPHKQDLDRSKPEGRALRRKRKGPEFFRAFDERPKIITG